MYLLIFLTTYSRIVLAVSQLQGIRLVATLEFLWLTVSEGSKMLAI